MIDNTCGNSYQCYYDYAVSLNRQYGIYAKYYLDDIVNIKSNNLKKGELIILFFRATS